jgi:hypothetical protein
MYHDEEMAMWIGLVGKANKMASTHRHTCDLQAHVSTSSLVDPWRIWRTGSVHLRGQLIYSPHLVLTTYPALKILILILPHKGVEADRSGTARAPQS